MKLTIELDPTADRALFDRVMAAVMDHPAPVAMTAAAPETTPVEMSEEPAPVEMSEEPGPRVYGEPGAGRKRRSKEEKAEDDEIDRLASITSMAITTDIPAAELLQQMKEVDETKEESSEDGFEMETEEPMTLEDFRAKAITYNKKHGKEAITILSEYGSGLTKIPAEKYGEVIARLEALGDA